MARQIIKPKINIGLYAAAGKKRNLTGEAVAGIGSALGKAFTKAKQAKDKADAQNKAEEEKNAALQQSIGEQADLDQDEAYYDDMLKDVESEELKQAGIPIEGSSTSEVKDVLDRDTGGEDSKTYSYSKFGDDERANYLKTNPGDFEGANKHRDERIQAAKLYNDEKYKTDNPTEDVDSVNNVVKSQYTGGGEYIADTSQTIQGSTTLGSAGIKPLKMNRYQDDNSPIDRRRRTSANIDSFDDQSQFLGGITGGGSDAISKGQQSQFIEGRTFVEKDQRASAHAWMGVGASWADGWNLGVDERNYKKQVQADLADFYKQEFAGLEVERTGNDVFDASMQELMVQKKKDLAAHLNEREQAFAEGRGGDWAATNQQLKAVPAEAANLVDAMKKLYPELRRAADAGEIDWDAMGSEQTDELLSFMNGGANWGVADIEGEGLSLMGATRGGRPYLKSVKAMINDLKGPQYVPKKNAFKFVDGVVEDFRKNQDKYKKVTVDPRTGNKITVPMSMEEITPMLMRQFDAELTSGPATRAYASRSNWDDDGMTPEQFDAAVRGGEKDPKDFVKAKFLEVATQMLSPYLAQYSETPTGMSTLKERQRINTTEEAKKEIKRKETAANKEAKYDSLIDDIMTEAQGDFSPEKVVDPEIGSIPELKIKANTDYPGVGIFEGAKGVKSSDYDQKSGILTITPTSAITVKDGSTTVKTVEPQKIDFTQEPDIVRRNIKNLLIQLKISPESLGSSSNTKSVSVTQESVKAKLAEIQSRIKG